MDPQQLIKQRANAKRRFTRTRNALLTLLGKTEPSRNEMLRLWQEGDTLRGTIDGIVHNLRICLESVADENSLDRLDQWCLDFDREWDVFSTAMSKLEAFDARNVSLQS